MQITKAILLYQRFVSFCPIPFVLMKLILGIPLIKVGDIPIPTHFRQDTRCRNSRDLAIAFDEGLHTHNTKSGIAIDDISRRTQRLHNHLDRLFETL